MPLGGRLRPIVVEALLNRQVSAPLMLDTGAMYTVLTKHSFLTPGGPIQSPVTTLKSTRMGTAETQDAAAAVDAEGHLPMGFPGMTCMRHFKVTVYQAGPGQI